MIPGRGLRWSGQALSLGRRRPVDILHRPFSSSPRAVPKSTLQLSRHGILHTRPLARPQIIGASAISLQVAAIRFKSTSPSPSPAVTELAAEDSLQKVPSWANAPESSLDSSFDFSNGLLLDMPERIGYLKEMGLDFGWGPTSVMEWCLEHVHVLAGTPWWASIVLTAVLVRAAMFYPYLAAADNAARMATVMPITKPLTAKMQELARMPDKTTEMMQVRAEIQKINRRAGVKLYRSFIPLLQIFAGYGSFVLLRAMANLPVPGLEFGGVLWFQNLAFPDPFYLLPVMTAGVLHLVLRNGGETGVNTMSPSAVRALSIFLPAITVLFTWWLPAALQLSFFVSGVLSGGQSALFRQAWFRSMAGMVARPAGNDLSSAGSVSKSKFSDRIVTVPRSGYRDTTPGYQAPRGASAASSAAPAEKKTIFSGLKNEASLAAKSIKESKDSISKWAETRGEKGKNKSDATAAAAFEAKRAFEEERRQKSEAEQRRLARKARKQQQ